MKLITFEIENEIQIGALKEDRIVPFSQNSEIPKDMLGFLEDGEKALDRARDLFETSKTFIESRDVKILKPILRPPKIIAIGLNYADHLAEIRASGREMETPEVPMIFNKQSLSANGPYDDIHKPFVSDKLDYEGELTIVIGKKCRHVSKDNAKEVIAGYTIGNDISVRDWQLRVPTFTIGKSFDTHCPFGPSIVTKDDITDPHKLDLVTEVNGEIRQKSNTKHLIFNCYDIVEHLSTAFTLEPGDLILTGTPSGVGVVDNLFLKHGDTVKVSISEIGFIENKIVNEPLES
jgi:2-keto-4-pentenoate hydratase/2-oxohepta-3-ene-1,7-dioic acid hydratase in catechol pathway